MRKIVFSLMVLICMFVVFLLYQHNQHPTIKDVYSGTKKWSEGIDEVYHIEQIDNEWIVFFKRQNFLCVSKFEKNWLGNWKVVDWNGNEGTIGSTPLDLPDNKGVIWGATEVSWNYENNKISFYFGMITNPKISKISLETADTYFETINLLESNNNKFFFLVQDSEVIPFSLKAVLEGNEIIINYSTFAP